MRRALLLLLLTLPACPKREEARPAPETKPSAAPPVEYAVEKLTCTDGVLGAPPPPAASASASAAPSGSGGIGSLFAADAGLFAPIGDGGLGLGGIGIGGSGFGSITGSGFGRPAGRLVHAVTAAPVVERGARALAVAAAACKTTAVIKSCHDDAKNPVGSLVFDIVVAESKATSATKTGGDVTDETLTKCVSDALVAATYDAAANGTTAYKITFEPARLVRPPTLKDVSTTTAGPLPKEVVRRIVRANFNKIRFCYDKALKSNPAVAGKLVMKFTVDTAGKTKDVTVADGTISDPDMRSCVTGAFAAMSFPTPDGGEVVVTYPIEFAPG